MESRLVPRLKTVATPFGRFVDGFLYFFRGFGFLARHPRLWPYALAPFAINTVIVLLAVGVLIYFSPEISGWIMKPPTQWTGWFLYIPYLALFVLLVPLLMYILFFMVLPGITSPVFKGRLTKYTREILKGTEITPVGGLYVDVVEPTLIELRKAGRLLLITLLLLPLNVVPVLGQAAYVVLMSYFSWTLMAFNYLEYPIDSESTHTPLSQKRLYVRSRRWPALGFGFAVSLTYLVPFLNFFCVPVGVVGATLLYQDYGEMDGVPGGPEEAPAGKDEAPA